MKYPSLVSAMTIFTIVFSVIIAVVPYYLKFDLEVYFGGMCAGGCVIGFWVLLASLWWDEGRKE